MNARLILLAALFLVFSANVVKGQLAVGQSSSILNHFAEAVNKPIRISIGSSGQIYKNITAPPMYLNILSVPGDPIWTGSITAQSFNNGKFGRFYCWDAQGNLRSSYLFLDISGKRKRGLKLVFPKHRLLVDTKNKIAF
jgi:hypothetical protein